jgi:dipeptide transport system ATP-binding protein
MTAVVAASNLARTYRVRRSWLRPSRELRAVGGLSFDIEAGHTLAVVGESGCGKSTLARLVSLIEKPTTGTLIIDGIDTTRPSADVARQLRRTVQLVFQNPYGSLNPRRKVGAILEEPLVINTDLSKAERTARAVAMLTKVGLRPEHRARYPHMFSGGQRQRIAIARTLMLRPKLLVADEPTSALDVSVQAQILNLLLDLQQELGLAYLFISHDLAVVRHIAHEVLVMYLGLAVEQGPRQQIFERPLHPYTRMLLAATPGMGATPHQSPRPGHGGAGELPSPLDPPAGCVFSTRCPHATQLCRQERPVLRPLNGRTVACHYAEDFLASSPRPDALSGRFPPAPARGVVSPGPSGD